MMLDAIDEEEKRAVTETFIDALATVLLASRDDTDTTAQRSALAAARAKAKDKLSITEYDAAVFQAFRGAGIAMWRPSLTIHRLVDCSVGDYSPIFCRLRTN
jgi:hypothetical protein